MANKLTFSIGTEDPLKMSNPAEPSNEGGSEQEKPSQMDLSQVVHGKGQKSSHGKHGKKEHSASAAVRFIVDMKHKKHKKKVRVSEADPHVMFVLGEHPEEENRMTAAFVELDELWTDPTWEHPPEWREVARWIKFEEEVEESADRWSKPYVAIQSLMSVFEVRSCLAKAVMLLDFEATGLDVICDEVIQRLLKKKHLDMTQEDHMKEVLMAHHSTLFSRQKRHVNRGQQLHIIRSLTEIGKRHSAKDVSKMSHIPSRSIIKSTTNLGVDRMDPLAVPNADANGTTIATTPSPENELSSPPPYDHHFFKKVPQGAEAVNILVGETEFLKNPIAVFVRLKEAVSLGDMTEVPVPTRFMFILLGTMGNGHKYQQIGRAVGTLFSDEMFHDFAIRSTSRGDLLAGIDEFLSASSLLPPAQWDPKIRIEPPLALPSQENRKLLANAGNATQTQATTDAHHHHHHHHATSNAAADVRDAVSIAVPLIKANAFVGLGSGGGGGGGGRGPGGGGEPSVDLSTLEGGESMTPSGGEVELDRNNDPALMRTGRLFGGLVLDIKRRAPHYLSDITDAIHIQCFASFFFLYFACLAPIITFGGLLSQVTGGYLGTMESIVSGAVVGILYALFAGQPLTIQGSTGPVLVFESIIYRLCEGNRWSYLSFRFWIGMWTSLFLLIMVAFDLSALVRFITRFTEESFALLIALIFIIEALKKTYAISEKYPVNVDWSPSFQLPMDCRCIPPTNYTNYQLLQEVRHQNPILDLPFIGTNETDAHQSSNNASNPILDLPFIGTNETDAHQSSNNASNPILDLPFIGTNETDAHQSSNNASMIDWNKIGTDFNTWDAMETQKRCLLLKGTWNSNACEKFFAPDIFFFGVILFIGCFFLSYMLRGMRNSRFFPNRIRSLIADFAVMIAIVLCTLVDYLLGLHTPKLQVPLSFEPTLGYSKRGWVIYPFNGNPWWSSLIACGPACLAVILIFMDQQITAVIVNRRENKLKKGGGYHLDLLIVAATIAINSLLGIPWFVAATVLSINHVISLKKESESAAPGERPIFLGCREQRITGFLIFLFIGLSVFMASVLRLIPMAVLYGVFLLMGITSVNGLQIIQRFTLIFMPAKYQPDYPYLRHVRLWRIHMFTMIQVVCLILLWVIKSIHKVSILFPLMVLAMCFIRKGLDFVFTQEELHWLDDILPESSCSKKQNKPPVHDYSSKLTLDSLPMSEPLLLKGDGKPPDSDGEPFSVSEEVSKTLIWRQLSGIGLVNQGDDDDEDENKKSRKKKIKSNRKSGKGDDDGDSSGKEKRHHKRFRSLRLFSNDFDGAIGRDIDGLFRNTESEANQTDDNSTTVSVSKQKGKSMSKSQRPQSSLKTPEIHINPPSHQGSPKSSRRGSKA